MRQPIPILLYHSVGTEATPHFRPWMVKPETFAAHMEYLRAEGYAVLALSELAQAIQHPPGSLPARPVLITFDDGFADFYTNALPVLQRCGFAATLYVSTAYVGATSRWLWRSGEGQRAMLSWAQLREARSCGILCGSHAHTHRALDILPRDTARNEIELSTQLLQQELGEPVETFAYPHGYYDRSVRRMVQSAGHTSACGVKHALSALHDDVFGLARIIVHDVDVQQLAALLQGAGLPVAPGGLRIRPAIWRLVRRLRAQHDGPPAA